LRFALAMAFPSTLFSRYFHITRCDMQILNHFAHLSNKQMGLVNVQKSEMLSTFVTLGLHPDMSPWSISIPAPTLCIRHHYPPLPPSPSPSNVPATTAMSTYLTPKISSTPKVYSRTRRFYRLRIRLSRRRPSMAPISSCPH
jgi:hypothetical protein